MFIFLFVDQIVNVIDFQEERDLSPVRQKRLEEVWPGSEVAGKGKSARRSSGLATGVASLRSADFASDTTPAVAVGEKGKESRREADKTLREPEKETDKKREISWIFPLIFQGL